MKALKFDKINFQKLKNKIVSTFNFLLSSKVVDTSNGVLKIGYTCTTSGNKRTQNSAQKTSNFRI
jgi:hypothetical protein